MVVCPSFTERFARTSYGNGLPHSEGKRERITSLRVLCKSYNIIKNSIRQMLGPKVLTFIAGEAEIGRKSGAKVRTVVNYS
jgi:hypothetical protein